MRNLATIDIVPQDNTGEALPPAVPASSYRHAAPSGPWPWMDFSHIDITSSSTAVTTVITDGFTNMSDPTTAVTDASTATKWSGYPQNLFPNWTPDQVQRSQMLIKCSKNQSSTIYWMDVLDDAKFITPNMTVTPTNDSENDFWNMLQGERPGGIRVRSLFVDNLTPSVLRMLGTRYNIGPFFFTSSINWIPTRYQDAPIHGEGDHITITLPFVRTHRSRSCVSPTPSWNANTLININTQAPFPTSNNDMLSIDLLAIHMVRSVKTSTIISYHPESIWCRTSAKLLHSLTRLVGESVYWQIIFSKTKDPTFLLLAILWYALYAWDESFELLYKHVSELELEVLHDSRIEPTRKLHIVEPHLLHCKLLLHNFEKSVCFIQETPNPAMESEAFTKKERKASREVMEHECKNLLSEIDRLEKRREVLSNRLKNVMDLAFATVNIEDSKQMLTLTQQMVRGSMQQISYMTMAFLPASLLASVFGNIVEIKPGSLETLAHYLGATISLTLLTFYVAITIQKHTSIHEENAKFSQRAAWPYLFLRRWILEKRAGAKGGRVKTVNEMV